MLKISRTFRPQEHPSAVCVRHILFKFRKVVPKRHPGTRPKKTLRKADRATADFSDRISILQFGERERTGFDPILVKLKGFVLVSHWNQAPDLRAAGQTKGTGVRYQPIPPLGRKEKLPKGSKSAALFVENQLMV